MQQKLTGSWIDYIVNKALENYDGRQIVIWGKYVVSECIKNELEKYKIDIAFYVDCDTSKIDEEQVYSPDCLYGKSNKYYVIIPIAFYQSVKDMITGGGYFEGADYFYFCDCVLRQDLEYYEDSHGNKIIGNYQGLKFVFSGFHSEIKIGKNVLFQKTVFYVHNDSKIVIGDNAQFVDNEFYIYHSSEVIFGTEVYLKQNNVIIEDAAKLEMRYRCNINRLSIKVSKCAEILLGQEVNIFSNTDRRTNWILCKYAKFRVGNKGKFAVGDCFLDENALFKIGTEFSINENYRIVLDSDTSIFIGNDCMFSYDISMRSNDGHSIFDTISRKNINSCNDINKSRKIVIGHHVWIGERAYILYGTQIGDSSIIGAMSFVKNRIPNNCIAAGIPAKVIRKNITWSREYGVDDIIKCGQEYILNTEGYNHIEIV